MDRALVLLALSSAFFFALALVLTQFGLRTRTPLAGACISVPTTAAMFIALSPLTIDFSGWNTGSARLFAAAGLFFPVTVTLLTFVSNRHIGPNLTGALGNLSPLFAVALAIVLLGETPAAMQMLGAVTVCVGAAILVLGRARTDVPVASWILLLPLMAAFLRGVVQPVVKLGLHDWPSPFAAVTIGYAVSAVVLLATRLVWRAAPTRDGLGGWFWFAGVGLSNGAAVLALYAALSRGPVTLVAPLVACYPLFTLVLHRMIGDGRTLNVAVVAGVFVTVAGVALLLAG